MNLDYSSETAEAYRSLCNKNRFFHPTGLYILELICMFKDKERNNFFVKPFLKVFIVILFVLLFVFHIFKELNFSFLVTGSFKSNNIS